MAKIEFPNINCFFNDVEALFIVNYNVCCKRGKLYIGLMKIRIIIVFPAQDFNFFYMTTPLPSIRRCFLYPWIAVSCWLPQQINNEHSIFTYAPIEALPILIQFSTTHPTVVQYAVDISSPVCLVTQLQKHSSSSRQCVHFFLICISNELLIVQNASQSFLTLISTIIFEGQNLFAKH